MHKHGNRAERREVRDFGRVRQAWVVDKLHIAFGESNEQGLGLGGQRCAENLDGAETLGLKSVNLHKSGHDECLSGRKDECDLGMCDLSLR